MAARLIEFARRRKNLSTFDFDKFRNPEQSNRMNGKRPYGSPRPPPEKGHKRACLENSQVPQVTMFSSTNHVDMASGEEADAEAGPQTDVFANDGSEFQTSPPSAAHDDKLGEDSGHFGSSNPNPESSPSTNISALIEHETVHRQEGATAEKASTTIRDRAVGALLTDWPAKAGGLTEDICDLKALKQIMTSQKLNQNHKAMWVSLVQTIIYEPDRRSVLDFLQNTLSGDAALPDSFESRPIVPRQDVLTLREWAVTGSLMVYGEKKERWSAAHFVDLALWVGGPDAGIQAARALKIFGVWNPSGDYNPHFDRKSIRVCQDHRTVLGRIWPKENDGSRLLAWANHYSSTTEQPFDSFVDAHSYLLRQCIGENLKLFPSLARNFAQVGEVSSRIISRAYLDSTLAPILREHFDTNVDLELAYEAAVASQTGSLDRNPVKRVNPGREPRLAISRGDNHRNQGQSRHKLPFDGKFQYDDGKDDSEPELTRDEKPIKQERDIQNEFTPNQIRVSPRRPRVWNSAVSRDHQGGTYRVSDYETSSKRSFKTSTNQIQDLSLDGFHRLNINQEEEPYEAGKEADEAEDANETDDEGDEAGDADDADESEDVEDVAEGEVDEVEDAAQIPPERPVDEQSFMPRRQPRNPQDLNISRLTRGMSRMSERITNDLYQQSRDISSDVIAEFIKTRNPRFSHNWREVLGHRTTQDMLVAGREDRPPYPLNNPLVDSPRTHHTREHAQANLYSAHVSNIQSDVDRLKNLAQSQ
ncbi:hypothetical protein KCU98_g466, partial [Aureobasidium melanogenum]